MLNKLDNILLMGVLSTIVSGPDDFYVELMSAIPQIVVCGPQSSGKSSVLQRICGILVSSSTSRA